MAKLNGTLMVLKQSTTTLVGQIDSSMSLSADMLDATTKDSTAKAKEYIPGETGWTMSVSGLYDPAASVGGDVSGAITALKAGTTWTVKYGQTTTDDNYWTGSALLMGVTLNGPKNDLASYSIELQGTGVLTENSN